MSLVSSRYQRGLTEFENEVFARAVFIQSMTSAAPMPILSDLQELVAKVAVQHALTRTRGNQVRAATLLGVNRNTIRNIMKRNGIRAESFT